jgi:hypothetical protein
MWDMQWGKDRNVLQVEVIRQRKTKGHLNRAFIYHKRTHMPQKVSAFMLGAGGMSEIDLMGTKVPYQCKTEELDRHDYLRPPRAVSTHSIGRKNESLKDERPLAMANQPIVALAALRLIS